MRSPLLAIVVPTRNRPRLLRRAVDTALAQDMDDVEVIVVDDASDDPVDLAKDPRLHVVRHDRPQGGAAARNTGTAAASAPFVCYLDDDDELLPHMARVSLEAHAGADLPAPVGVLTGIEVVDASGEVLETRLPATSPRGRDFWLEERPPDGSFHTKQTLVIERQVLRTLGGWDPSFSSRVHTELFLRLNPVCSLLGVPVVTYRLLAHGRSRVSQDPLLRQASFAQLLEKHAPAFAAHPQRSAEVLVDHAVHSWRDGERTAAARSLGRALRLAPGRATREGLGRLRHELRGHR